MLVKKLFAGIGIGSLGLLGLIVLFVPFYVLSVAFWSLPISLVFHWAGDPHSWWWACTHWGLLAPFVLG